MTDSRPKELIRAEKLFPEAGFKEALKIIEDFEKKEIITPGDQLSTLLLKGRIYAYNRQTRDAIKVGEQTYQMSQKLGLISESIDALLLKARIMFLGEVGKGLELILEAEEKINSLANKSSSNIQRQKSEILYYKSWHYFLSGDLDSTLKSAEQSLLLQKKIGNKLELAYNYLLMGYIYNNLRELETALNYATKSLELMEELDFQPSIGTSSLLVSRLYLAKNDYNQALNFCKKSLSVKEIGSRDKVDNLNLLGEIYYFKGEYNRSLKYYNQAIALAEEKNLYDQLALNLYHVGYIYRLQGEYDRVIETSESSLTLAEKIGYNFVVGASLQSLILVYLDKGSLEQAQQYLTRLEKLSDQTHQKAITDFYLLSKAMILKMDGRTRNRAEAEVILKRIIDNTDLHVEYRHFTLINLCDLYLEDLYLSKNLEILEDINPLLTELSMSAEKYHSYLWLAETKLLQAKLALIQMKMEDAKHLLTEAQSIAESHDLDLLAIKISSEHDTLLTQVDEWENLKEKEAPIEERMNLGSPEEIIDVMLQKRGIQPPELTGEEPVLLILVTEGNKIALSNPFTGDFTLNDALIVEFLSSFKTFSDQIFSDTFDRVKFGQYTILITTAEPFSICYMFQGQTYSARQKLIHFTEAIKKNSIILNLLTDAVNLDRVIEVNEYPSLEELIIESFMSDPQQFRVPFKAYGGDEPFVFASYAHRDKLEVYPIIDYLNKTGVNIWYDEGIPISENWKKSIAENIERCQEFLVFITPHILESEFVRKEISFALKKKKPFNAVYLKDTKLPTELEFEISDIQALHKYLMPEPDFSNKLREVLYTKLHE